MKKSKKNILKNKKFWIVVAVFSIMWVYSLWGVFTFSDNNYVGKIISLGSGSLVINDGKVGEVIIRYNSETPIISREDSGASLDKKSAVFIKTRKDQDNNLHAEFIRIIEKKKY